MPGIVVRKIGNSVEIRHMDVPLFSTERARAVFAQVGRFHFQLAAETIAGYISEEAPVGVSGSLAQSFGSYPATADGGIEVYGNTVESLGARVFSSLPHAIVIDQGRAPGARMPPVDAIMLWVERVLGIAESDDFELEEVAWAIAKSIQRRGITPRNFMEKGVRRALPQVESVFEIMGEAIAIALAGEGPWGGGAAAPAS